MATPAEQFENHWQLLSGAIETLLMLEPGQYPPISYEQTYSAVYKCVCQGFAEELYKRLMAEIQRQVEFAAEKVQVTSDRCLVDVFSNAWKHFSNGLSGILPIFNYMARFYVESRLSLNLRDEMYKMFNAILLDPILERLIALLWMAQNVPFAVQPAIMENVVRALYTLKPDTVHVNLDLYRRFIPNLVQHVHVDDLPDLQMEARQMIADAQAVFGMVKNENDPNFQPASNNMLCEDFNICNAAGSSSTVMVTDPVMAIATNKRSRSDMDEDVEDGLVDQPEEPSPPPMILQYRKMQEIRRQQMSANVDSDGRVKKKNFQGDE